MQEWALILSVWVEGDFQDMTRVAQFPDYATCQLEGEALQMDFMDRATFVKVAHLFDEGATIDKDAIRTRTVALYDCIKVPVDRQCEDQGCVEDGWQQSTTRKRLSDRDLSD